MREAAELLDELDTRAKGLEVKTLSPLACDKWIASSVMQKAIRRGDVNTALKSGMTLWRDDAVSFWRRLHIVSVEDVGVAAPETVAMTLLAFNASAWRRKRDDLRIGLTLVKLLAEGVKCRLGDEVYTIAANASAYEDARQSLTRETDQALCDTVLDKSQDVIMRAIALWALAGTKRLPADRMPLRDGNKALTVEVLQSLKGPSALTQGCIGAMSKTIWPLALFTPLLWQAHNGCPSEIVTRNMHDVFIRGVPLAALDTYTRLGKASIRELQRLVPDLTPYTVRQIGMGIFYSEGYALDKRLSSPLLDDCRDRGARADLEGGGLHPDKHTRLANILSQNAPLLRDIRKRRLVAYFETQQSDLFGGVA